MVISLAMGVVVGLLLGLTGAGGSIFAVPLLMVGLGLPIAQATSISLLAVAVSATVGTYMAWRRSYVRYRAAGLMAVSGVFTAPLGVHLGDWLSPAVLQALFAVVLLVVGWRMRRSARRSPVDAGVVRAAVHGEGQASHGHVGRINPQTGRLVWTVPVAAVIALIGAGAGFLSGLLGVGGGFFIVPALQAVLPLSMHSAVATSLMAIALTSSGTFVGALLMGREVAWTSALPFVAGAVAGMMLGRVLAPRLSGRHLQQGFGWLALVVAAGMAIDLIRPMAGA
jgi:uncharacterized membrane protein YfcA